MEMDLPSKCTFIRNRIAAAGQYVLIEVSFNNLISFWGKDQTLLLIYIIGLKPHAGDFYKTRNSRNLQASNPHKQAARHCTEYNKMNSCI